MQERAKNPMQASIPISPSSTHTPQTHHQWFRFAVHVPNPLLAMCTHSLPNATADHQPNPKSNHPRISHQPLPKVFGSSCKAEKHDLVGCRAFNAMVETFSQIFPDFPLSCSFLILIIFHGMVRNVALNGRPYPLSSVLPSRGGVLPWTTPGVALIKFHFFTY